MANDPQADITKHVVRFDIDGVLCEPQQIVSDEMRRKINELGRRALVYVVTGNTFVKARDLLYGVHVDGFFCNNADEFRDSRGRRIWSDNATEPLPVKIENTLQFLLGLDVHHYGNRIEWRNPRMVNFSRIGRFAPQSVRKDHDGSWRENTIGLVKLIHPSVECSIGGSISIDIYSKGADKSRAGMYINKFMNKNFVFVGDKTDIGGNDYPLAQYCFDNPSNICLTSIGTKHTSELVYGFINSIG
jgi:hydroxymethylpyrimidine pyrophosphatase-like HAD family hydrolase